MPALLYRLKSECVLLRDKLKVHLYELHLNFLEIQHFKVLSMLKGITTGKVRTQSMCSQMSD